MDVIPRYVKRMLDELESLMFCHEPAYACDHHIDRIYIMKNQPVHGLAMVRESGMELWDLTYHCYDHERWDKHIDTVKDSFLFWAKSGQVKAIVSFCYGWKHTIFEYSGDLEAAKETALLLIESFRR